MAQLAATAVRDHGTEDRTALRLRLAEALLAAGTLLGARAELERALDEAPADPRIANAYAPVALRAGDAGAVLRVAGPQAARLDAGARLALGTAALALAELLPEAPFADLARRADAVARGPAGDERTTVRTGLAACGRRDLVAPPPVPASPAGPHDPATLEAYFRRLWDVGDLDASPHARATFRWLMEAAAAVGPGDVVLDAGAGQCRYAPFFAHARYLPTDFGQGDATWDYSGLAFLADLEALPLAPCSVQLVFNTSVMEHVRRPSAVMRELWRVLRWGGSLRMYVPFHYGIHQPPHDYYRYSRHAWDALCAEAGFARWEVTEASGDFYAAAHWFTGVLLDSVQRLSVEVRAAVGLFLRDVLPGVQAIHERHAEHADLPIGYFVNAWKLPRP
jgi:SAM-dependent methyltransferase